MNLRILAVTTAQLAWSAGVLSAQPDSPVLAAGQRRVLILAPNGAVTWEHPAGLVHDAWMLGNGNILFADGASVTEVTRDHRVAFVYHAAQQAGGGTFSCQRLGDGRTVVGENSTGRVVEIDHQGNVAFALQTTPWTPGSHQNLRMVRKLENGNYLVCHSGAHQVKEYAPDGTVVWQVETPNLAYAAIRTNAGTTLVSALDRLCEYDRSGRVVWRFAATDIAGVTITGMTGMHLLPSGAIAVGCYRAYRDGAGNGLFAISRDRRLLWRYANPSADSSMMAIQCLTADEKPLSGKFQR